MTKYLALALCALVITCSSAMAGVLKTITLKDGSVIQGQIVQIKDNTYTVDSPAVGTVSILEDQIVSIVVDSQGSASGTTATPAAFRDDIITAAQNKIMADSDAMKDVQAIASDPEVVALMSDPAFLQAIQSRDPAAIQANPNTQKLMENPKVQAIINRLQSQGQN